MKKLSLSITILFFISVFSINAFAVDVRIKPSLYFSDPGEKPDELTYPIVIYMTQERRNNEPPLEYIGYITITDKHTISYTPRGNHARASNYINSIINEYLLQDEGILTVSSGTAPAKSWHGLCLVLTGIEAFTNIYFFHVTNGKDADDSFFPIYKKSKKAAIDQPRFTLQNPKIGMETVYYTDIKDWSTYGPSHRQIVAEQIKMPPVYLRFDKSGKKPDSLQYPIVIYMTQGRKDETRSKYIGFITINDINTISYTPYGDNAQPTDMINTYIDMYLHDKNKFEAIAGKAPEHSWNSLSILLYQSLYLADINYINITSGKDADCSFIPVYTPDQTAAPSYSKLAIQNPQNEMETVHYRDFMQWFLYGPSNM